MATCPTCGQQTLGNALAKTEAVAIWFPTVGDTKNWALTTKQAVEWQCDYPNLDVEQQIRNARQWVGADVRRRKTAGGMKRFLVAWLNRATDHAPRNAAVPAGRKTAVESNLAGLRDDLRGYER